MYFIEQWTNILRNIAAPVTAGALVYGLFFLHQEFKLTLGKWVEVEISEGVPNFKTGEIPSNLGDQYRIQFWTPSARTKETPGVKEWLKVDESMLDQFAELLMNSHIVKGYSRYEVIGAGLGVRKVGEWWSATLVEGVTVKEFLTEYNKFWKPGNDSTYMEVMHLSGGYAPQRQVQEAQKGAGVAGSTP
jgi:hypothetical protein